MKYGCKYFKTDFQHFLIFILLSWSELFKYLKNLDGWKCDELNNNEV